MPKKGRRSDRDDALAANPGGLGDEDYDWIKYLGEGRSAAPSSATMSASAATALQAPPRTITAPPERPVAPPERRTAQPRRVGRETGWTADGDIDPRGGRGADPYAGPATRGRGAAAGETTRFAAAGDDWADGGDVGSAAGRPAAGPPTTDQPRRSGSRGRVDRSRPEADDRDAPGDGTGTPRPLARSSRTEPGGGSDKRGRSGTGQAGGTAVERRPGANGPGRAVKVRQGRATDLLFNPAAEDYGQPLYPQGGDAGQSPPAASANGTLTSPSRPGRQAADPFASPRGRLDTAEFAQPLYADFDAGQATGARQHPAWPDDDPLADTDPRGRRLRTGPQPRVDGLGRFDRTGPQRRTDALGRTDAVGRTGPQRRVDALGPTDAVGRTDALTGPDRVSRTGPQPRVDPLSAPSRTRRTGPQRRVDGLGGPDALADSGVGVLWSSESASASVAPEAAIANAPGRRSATGPFDRPPFDRPAFDGPDQLAEPLDRPSPAPRSPVRKPGKGAKKARPGQSKAGKGAAKPGKSRPRSGRRRKVTMLLGGLVVIAVLAAVGYFKLMPRTSHVVSAPATVGGFVKQQANATATNLKNRIVAAAGGAVNSVVAAVYEEKKGPGTSKGPQIVVFIGGNLTGSASAGDLINAYMTRLHGAFTTSPGSLGGQAACAPGANGGPAECAWADGDTFGVVVSATMTSKSLADEMRQMRPQVEHIVK